MSRPKFLFGDIVVVNENEVGVILKTWQSGDGSYNYDIYIRMFDVTENFDEDKIDRYRIVHKYLDEDDLFYQNNY